MKFHCELPWPHRDLSPNARVHWARKANVKKRARYTAMIQAHNAHFAALGNAKRVEVALEFVPPDNRRRDLDNLIASMKAPLDGLADAMNIDDSCFTLRAEMADRTQVPGCVLVTASKAK